MDKILFAPGERWSFFVTFIGLHLSQCAEMAHSISQPMSFANPSSARPSQKMRENLQRNLWLKRRGPLLESNHLKNWDPCRCLVLFLLKRAFRSVDPLQVWFKIEAKRNQPRGFAPFDWERAERHKPTFPRSRYAITITTRKIRVSKKGATKTSRQP